MNTEQQHVADPYRPSSRAVQDRVGVRELADHVGRSMGQGIRPVAAAFLELQPMLVLGGADPASGKVWASLRTGEPGFVRATGPHQISLTTELPDTDPLTPALKTAGTPVGTIALDPRTRRRMRLNGRARPTRRGLAIEADQVFSNCPKHLQKRELLGARAPYLAPRTTRGTALTPPQCALITASDTFFLATVHETGADASHRGGNPGFVRVLSPRELEWPDYPGNAMFLTLGNLTADPRAGLLFLDWTTGATLQLTGTAVTVYAADGTRTVRFTVAEARATESASPWIWSAPEYSPANPRPPRTP
ncbi:pyridoxamine 5'-phosphate oxidase family protein [Streptomyces flavofungini]|uniref:Pyridoxamine 5'-phosphate oxidase family protein n=1 Tax=Streptomyces flavofungini TaxID=68200 RepID=A0ABS0XDT9_9ACTN|nr:pyridoxamine 5'-phosphate oxidase family protein [Streptomyces flavofungini]MBJ3811365.1 pyridoxamine 5'-phosphate oxidase family protein [Streptomyces flavofungini]